VAGETMSLSLHNHNELYARGQYLANTETQHPSDELHAIKLPGNGPENAKTITVRLANTDGQRNAARMLVNRMYSWRGYGDNHHILTAATKTTFTVYDESEIVGTLTLGVDSDKGLVADEIFSEEIDAFRYLPNTKICELTKLAFDTAVPSKPLLASFFHIIFIYGNRCHQCTDLFIEVNPRHRRFYEAMLGFQSIGDLKINKSVDAPAQLMWLKVSEIRKQIDQYANGTARMNARSLYPFFFSQREEAGIYARLAGDVSCVPTPTDLAYWNFGIPPSSNSATLT
jgi:hypothetical protein